MNSHSTMGGIRDVVKSEVIVELAPDDIAGLAPRTGVAHGGQSQRNQSSQGEMHFSLWSSENEEPMNVRGYLPRLAERRGSRECGRSNSGLRLREVGGW